MSPKDAIPSQEQQNRRLIEKALSVSPSIDHVHVAMQALDLTSLTGTETTDDISALCSKAKNGKVAAVCVYPQYVSQVAQELKSTDIQIATVINFPHGDKTNDSDSDTATPQNTKIAIEEAIANGATEIDIVVDRNYFEGSNTRDLLRACREACGENIQMKVILETAALHFDEDIEMLTSIAIEEGANFIKTSTGKYVDSEFPENGGGASMEAVLTMCKTLNKYRRENSCGLKISGGVSHANYAQFIALVEGQMGVEFTRNSDTFRFGASSIYDDLALTIDGETPAQRPQKRNGLEY